MMATRTDAWSTSPAPAYRPELLIAVATVTVIALAATQPGFLVASLCVGLALTAVIYFLVFFFGLVFFLPWCPCFDLEFVLLYFLLFPPLSPFSFCVGRPLTTWV